MKNFDRQLASQGIVGSLTVYAFANSYLHGVSWVQAHTESGRGFAYGTAAIPELILISTLLRGKKDLKALVGALVSIAWTLWVNGASAASGASGMIVALTPPVAAVLCAWFSDHGSSNAAVATATKPGVVSEGIIWLQAQKSTLSISEIADARGCSKTSAAKIKKAVTA